MVKKNQLIAREGNKNIFDRIINLNFIFLIRILFNS